MNDNSERDPRLFAIPDTHGHCKGEHKPYVEERPLPLTARMLFLWFYHACRRGYPRFLMVADHMNYLTFEDPAAVNLVRRALKLAQAGDLYGAAETANVDVGHASVVGEGLRRGMRFSIGSEVDNDPRSRPDAQNIVDAMRPDAMIRSVHFVPIAHPVHGENWPWPFDNPEFKEHLETVGAEALWELYVTALLDAIERLPGHIVGHFYAPAVIGAWPDPAKLEEYEDRVVAAAAERGMAIEFNTRFLYREHSEDEKRRYLDANRRLLRKCRERGVGISVGSDAHSPKDQGAGFETVLAVLDDLEINEIVFPIAGRLLRVALKVVREPEPEPLAIPEAPEPEKDVEAQTLAARPAEAGAPGELPIEAPVEEAPRPVKPLRKARPAATPTRPKETSPERHAERAHPAIAESAVSEASEPAETGEPTAHAEPPAETPTDAHLNLEHVDHNKHPAIAERAGKPVKAAAKGAKAPSHGPGAAKSDGKVVPKKAAPAKKGSSAKKAAPVKKAAAKKANSARATAKKAAPKKATAAKKATAKKSSAKKAPARTAPARKASSAKKTSPKKSAKRR